LGSLGDLHPFIALGIALRARGASVVVACAAEYGLKVRNAGLAFRPVRPSFADMQQSLGMDRAALTRAAITRGDFLFRRIVMPSVQIAYVDLSVILADADLVLTSSLAFGARLAAERRTLPWIAIVLQPAMFLSAFDPPVLPGVAWLAPLLRRLGPGASTIALGLVKRAIGSLLGPVRRLRRDIGLPDTDRNPLFEGQFSADGAIGLYSSLLGDVQPDYPEGTAIVGFAPFDSEAGAGAVEALDESLQQFLGAGARPVVFTLGSTIVNSAGSFYRESVAAARLLGARAVLLVGENFGAAYDEWHSTDVYVSAYAPHSLLFPHAAAIVHQGGIGTLAQALLSGRPHLVVPFFADQLDNAARAVRLGSARSLSPGRYRAVRAARALARLTSDAHYLARADALREVLSTEDGAGRAADVVLDRLKSRVSAKSSA